jgi:hypothetical protein
MAKPIKLGRRLRNARIECDKAADAQATLNHRGMCRGFFNGLYMGLNEFLIEPQGETRMHKDDAREVKALMEEFRAAAFELFREARIQQHGERDTSIDDLAAGDLSNVISFKDRAAEVRP